MIDFQKVLNLLFPPQCLVCEAIVPDHGTLCLPCWRHIMFITDPMCARCGLPFEAAIADGALCGECLREPPSFSQARSVLRYDDASRSLILKLKYQDRTALASIYGAWLAKAGRDMIAQCHVIVPVPLHYARFVRRRYNQSALLAQSLARHCDLSALPDALRRIRHTPPQTGLTAKQRQENVRGAFVINARHAARVKGRTILLVDDVATTTATLEHCARALLKGGVSNVYALTLARTL